jgi:carbonic anhydrase
MSEKSHPDPKTVLKQLLEGNVRYVEEHSSEFEALKLKQTPKVALLTCCDSRVPQNLFDVDSPNEIFTVRNIGNQYGNSEGSVKYPILHLHTPLLIVLGHTGCGAIKAVLSDYREDDEAIQKEVIGLVNAIRSANQTRDMSKITDEDQKLAIYAQVNVDHQISKIVAERNLKAKIQKQMLYVVGMIFDIHGLYGGKSASVYITNINGITDINAMKKHELAVEMGKVLLNSKLKRL